MLYYADKISDHRAKTNENFLLALGVPLAKTGYYTYKASELQPSGIPEIDSLPPNTYVQVYRDEADVFAPAAMASFEGKSVTYNHPSEGLLTPDNDRQHSRGHIQNVRKAADPLPDGTWALIGDLHIKDSQLIQYIEHGVADELSCGYQYRLEPYQDGYRMTNIRGNHVAVVSAGRAGSYIKVLDAKPEEGSTTVKEELAAVGSFFKDLGLRLVAADAESETAEKQKEKDKEALKLKERTEDSAEEVKKVKEEKEAADKRAHDAEEETKKMKSEKEATDARFNRLMDALEGKGKCTCEAEEGELHDKDCPMFKEKKEAVDSDLIPVETLPAKERPTNPIPGGDALAIVDGLRKIRPLVAASDDKTAIDAFNRAMDAAKHRKPVTDADYALLLDAASKVDPKARELSNVHSVADAYKPGSYEESMKKFHRTDPLTWGKTQ